MPRFVQLSGRHTGESFPAHEGTVLGRDASCELTLAEGSISRRHARLIFQDGNWQLIDMESRNGLFFEDERVSSVVLQGGEEIRLGKLRLRFHLDSGDGFEEFAAEPTGDGNEDELTNMIQPPPAQVEPVLPPSGLASERRAARVASMQQGSRLGWLGGDLAQRSALVRWSVYLLVLAIAIAACVGAFMLAQKLRS